MKFMRKRATWLALFKELPFVKILARYQVATLSVLFLLGAWLISFDQTIGDKQTICLFKNATGLPCFGCGLGKSIGAITHLHIEDSFKWHPLGWYMVLIMFGLAYLDVRKGLGLKTMSYDTTRNPKGLVVVLPFVIYTLYTWLELLRADLFIMSLKQGLIYQFLAWL